MNPAKSLISQALSVIALVVPALATLSGSAYGQNATGGTALQNLVAGERCLDVAENRNGGPVVVASCGNQRERPFQYWTLQNGQVRNNRSGLCLDVAENKDGGRVVIASCGNRSQRPFQYWTVSGESTLLLNEASGLCLDVAGNGAPPSAVIKVCDFANRLSQIWKQLTLSTGGVASGRYVIRSVNQCDDASSAYCDAELSFPEGTTGNPVVRFGNRALWTITRQPNGLYTIGIDTRFLVVDSGPPRSVSTPTINFKVNYPGVQAVRTGTPIEWAFEPVAGKPNVYTLVARQNCGQLCGEKLMWMAPTYPEYAPAFETVGSDYVYNQFLKMELPRKINVVLKNAPKPAVGLSSLVDVEWQIVATTTANTQTNGYCNGARAACSKTLDNVTFAGSHNAGAGYRGVMYYWSGGAALSDFYRNQMKSFTEQLEAGIRFLDIDTSYNPGGSSSDWWNPAGAWITHGPRAGNVAWAGPVRDLFHQVMLWLERHPREVVIVYFNNNVHPAENHEEIANDIQRLAELYAEEHAYVLSNQNTMTLWDLIRLDRRLVIFMHSVLSSERTDNVPRLINTSGFLNVWVGADSSNTTRGVSSSCSGPVTAAESMCDSDTPYVGLAVIGGYGLSIGDMAGICDDYIEEAVSTCQKLRSARGRVVNYVLVDRVGTGGEGTGDDNLFEIVRKLNEQ